MAYAQVFDRIPTKITAGTSVSWRVSLPDFPAAEGWTLTYSLVTPSAQIVVESTPDGDLHLFEIPFGDTAEWSPGTYSWQSHVSNDTERYQVESGSVEVVEDLGAATEGKDTRTWIDTAIAALQAAIAGRASKTQLVQDVDGVRIQHMTITEQQAALDWCLDRRRALKGKWKRKISPRFRN